MAETALKRARRLHRSGNVSQARLDEAVANLDALKADTAAQQAERAVLVQRRTEGAVLAPAAGRVLRVALTNGSVVMPGRDQHPAAQIGAHAGTPAAEHAAAHH